MSLRIVFLFAGVILSCSDVGAKRAVVVGIKADADQINPVTHFSAFGRILCTGIYPRLLESNFDSASGTIQYTPLLAKRYEFSADHKTLTYHLRTDLLWEDGHPVTAKDVIFTFQLIADPRVASSKKEHIALLEMGNPPDIRNAIYAPNDSTVVFRFRAANPLQVYDTNLQPGFLPYHHLKDIDPSALKSHSFNLQPLSAGPYRVESWKKQTEIVFARNPVSGTSEKTPERIYFRVIPEYVTRLAALMSGEIDVMYPVNPQDAKMVLAAGDAIRLEVMRGRYYDYIGWQNIDQKIYRQSRGRTIVPHPLFGDARVRRALTMAVNREEIIGGFLGPYGHAAFGPISPVFRWAYNDTLKPHPFDRAAAQALLASVGWRDSDGDGILDKEGRPFVFDLVYDAGNDRREFAAVRIQKDLEAVGIKAHVQAMETNVFYDRTLNKECDAFLSGIGVSLMIDPTSEWNSNLEINRYNDVSYRNPEVDRLIEEGKAVTTATDAADKWKRFQELLHNDQPVTFLFWRDEIVAYRNTIQNTNTSLLGEIDKYWLWKIRE